MAVFSSTQNTAACWGGLTYKPNNIGRLGLEIGVVGGHVAFDPMRLQLRLSPDARHCRLADSQRLGQFAAGPMRGAIRRRLQGATQNPCLHRRCYPARTTAFVSRVEAFDAAVFKAAPPRLCFSKR